MAMKMLKKLFKWVNYKHYNQTSYSRYCTVHRNRYQWFDEDDIRDITCSTNGEEFNVPEVSVFPLIWELITVYSDCFYNNTLPGLFQITLHFVEKIANYLYSECTPHKRWKDKAAQEHDKKFGSYEWCNDIVESFSWIDCKL